MSLGHSRSISRESPSQETVARTALTGFAIL
jgi:hypothetical protein